MYPISEQLITHNRPKQRLCPQGFVIHDTATKGATAQNEHDYFDGGDRRGSAHYFVDWTQIIRTIPENEVAWHAGPTANNEYLSVEMCVPKTHDPEKFREVWNRTVWLVADAFIRYGWYIRAGLWSHEGISNRYHETDHQDPIEYFKEYGKTFSDFVMEVDEVVRLVRASKGENIVLKHVIVFWTAKDYSGAIQISERLSNCLMTCRDGKPDIHPDAKMAKHLIVVGGPEVKDHPNVTNLCGLRGPETAILAANYAKTL
jgi:N-acetylmuramoyl-L-alanine amidase